MGSTEGKSRGWGSGSLIIGLVVIGGIVGAAVALSGGGGGSSGGGGGVFGGSAVSAQYGQIFSVTYNDGQQSKDTYESYIRDALAFWENILDETETINVSVNIISDTPTTLATGGPYSTTNLKGGGVINFNRNASAYNWVDVTKHEFGHAMGMGLNQKWGANVITQGGSRYLDAAGFPETYQVYVDHYLNEGEDGGDKIPLSEYGGHFSEEVFDTELMTPYAEGPGVTQPTTLLTLTALKELGWNVDLTKAEPKN